MKPWEESWTAVSAKQSGNCNELHYGEGQHGCIPWGYDDDDFASAKLAAAAPEMARIIIEMACSRNCDYCYQKIDRYESPPGSGELMPYWHCHSDLCPIRVVMAKAGID